MFATSVRSLIMPHTTQEDDTCNELLWLPAAISPGAETLFSD